MRKTRQFDAAGVPSLTGEGFQPIRAAGRVTTSVQSTTSIANPDSEDDKLEFIGGELYRLGRYADSSVALEQARTFEQISDDSLILLADCQSRLGQREKAHQTYLQLALSRRLPTETLLGVTAGLSRLGMTHLAVQLCERQLCHDSSSPRLFFTLGVYLSHLGEPTYRVETLIRKAIELASSNPSLRLHYEVALASMLVANGRQDEAAEVLRGIDETMIERIDCRSRRESIRKQFIASDGFRDVNHVRLRLEDCIESEGPCARLTTEHLQ
ncbi:MAG: hypothetical protein AAF802_21995 [Planctomycetota bacterium]